MQMDVEEKQLCLTVRWGLKSATLKSKKSFLEDIVLQYFSFRLRQ